MQGGFDGSATSSFSASTQAGMDAAEMPGKDDEIVSIARDAPNGWMSF